MISLSYSRTSLHSTHSRSSKNRMMMTGPMAGCLVQIPSTTFPTQWMRQCFHPLPKKKMRMKKSSNVLHFRLPLNRTHHLSIGVKYFAILDIVSRLEMPGVDGAAVKNLVVFIRIGSPILMKTLRKPQTIGYTASMRAQSTAHAILA